MSLSSFDQDVLRAECKRRIEGLEQWLRRLIYEKFRDLPGNSMIEATDIRGNFIVKAETRRNIISRFSHRPGRYARQIDAAEFDDLIVTICKPDTYSAYFSDVFSGNFPHGSEQLRSILSRLIPPRNHLAHANPISIHDAERVYCYSSDIIISIKEYFMSQGLSKEFNAPLFVKATDSFGEEFHRTAEEGNSNSSKSTNVLHVGDRFFIDLEVDPSFLPDEYSVKWINANNMATYNNAVKLELLIDNSHVGRNTTFIAYLSSKFEWHRCGTYDDAWNFNYKVLPSR